MVSTEHITIMFRRASTFNFQKIGSYKRFKKVSQVFAYFSYVEEANFKINVESWMESV